MTLIDHPDEIPTFRNEAEEAAFWDTHAWSEEALEHAESDPNLPPPRPRKRNQNTSIRLDHDIRSRLKRIAHQRGKGYQTLIKEFIIERLYEEEKRLER